MAIANQAKNREQREQLPALKNKAYFNYGGQGPMPAQALAAIQKTFASIQEMGPFSSKTFGWSMEQTEKTRVAIATELGAAPETITFTENTTIGCNIALWGIDWQPGDRILLTDCEHPGIIATVQEIQRRFGVEMSVCPIMDTLNEGNPAAVIAEHLHPNTRLVVLSHILWNTGQVLPLAEIVQVCHNSKGATKVLVDAAQSVGVLPLNLTEIGVDFYAFTGHKWLCGPEGTGGFYLHPDARESLNPTFIGWRGVVQDEVGNPASWKPGGLQFEVATSAYPLYAGLLEAIAFHNQWGTAAERYQRILELSQYLWQKLADSPGIECLRTSPPQSGLVSFQLDKKRLKSGANHLSLVQFLEKQNYLVRLILNPNCVRACAHYFTEESEIDRLVDMISIF